jgi:hypothetical protein
MKAFFLLAALAIGPALAAEPPPGDFYSPGDIRFTSPSDSSAKCMYVAMRPPQLVRPPPSQTICLNGKCATETPSTEPWASVCVTEKANGAVNMSVNGATIPEILKAIIDRGYRQ